LAKRHTWRYTALARPRIRHAIDIDGPHIVMQCHFEMGRKKISTTIYITPEQSERLKQLHDKTKVPVAEYIRQGIDWVLEQQKHQLPGQLTLDVSSK
jgi:hypothetical protein